MSDEIRHMLNTILEAQQTTNARLGSMEERMDRMEGNMTDLKQRLERMEGGIKDLKDGQEREEHIMEKLALRSIEQESEI